MTKFAKNGVVVRILLLSGILSSILYVAIDVIGAANYPHYQYLDQAISEMSAIGAPTSSLLAPLYGAWSVLFLAFIAGVWIVSRDSPALRWSAVFMLGVMIVGFGFSLFPMNQRSAQPTFSDTMHLVVAGATMLLLTGVIFSGAKAFGVSFRRYSVATVGIMLVFFILTMRDVANIAADRPTPYMGLNERICMASWLLWIGVFSILLLRMISSTRQQRVKQAVPFV